MLVALPPVRVLFLSAKHLFWVARHAVARAKPAYGVCGAGIPPERFGAPQRRGVAAAGGELRGGAPLG